MGVQPERETPENVMKAHVSPENHTRALNVSAALRPAARAPVIL